MRHTLFRGMLVSTFLLLLVSVSQGVAASPTDDVRESLTILHNWLAADSHGAGWRKFLQSDDLEAQLEKGTGADPQVISEILAKYTSGKTGLSKSRFAAVRTALNSWLMDLKYGDPEKLKAAIAEAKGRFKPIEEGAVAKALGKLKLDMSKLDSLLSQTYQRRASMWKKHLKFSELEAQLAAEAGPDARVLQEIVNSYRGDHVGLELPKFVAVRESLLEYLTTMYYASVPELEKEYVTKIESLETSLAAYQQYKSGDAAAEVGQILGWLSATRQVDELVAGIREHYVHPNLYGHISRKLLAAGVEDKIYQNTRVSENINGTYVSGIATTYGNTSLLLIPDKRRAAIQLSMIGNTYSKTVGTQSVVTVYATGVTTFNAYKFLFMDGTGITTAPAQAACRTSTSINGLDAPPIIRQIAWGQVDEQKGQSERIASQRAAGQLQQQIDSQTWSLVSEANDKFNNGFRKPLIRRRALPRSMQFQTTSDAVHVQILQGNDFQLAAPRERPPIDDGHDLSLQVHESILGNLTDSAIPGETLTGERVAEIVQELTGEVPDELKGGPEATPWSIRFAASHPITLEFKDGTVRVAVRGTRFSSGDSEIRRAMEFSAIYKFEKSGVGSKLTRQGEVDARYLKEGRESIRENAVKTVIRKKFGAMFKEEIVSEGLELPGRWKETGKLHLKQLVCHDGWLTLGWQKPKPVLMATKPKE